MNKNTSVITHTSTFTNAQSPSSHTLTTPFTTPEGMTHHFYKSTLYKSTPTHIPTHTPQTIFWDVDDVVLQTLPTIVSLINTHYRLPQNLPPKSPQDTKDWQLHSIYKHLTQDQLHSLFESPEFWSQVTINPQFNTLLSSPTLSSRKNYHHVFLTKGSPTNLSQKESFISNFMSTNFPHISYDFIGLEPSFDKNTIDMKDSIVVDDNITNILTSNAKIKILVKNFLETDYNNSFGAYNDQIDIDDTLYIVDELDEVAQILEFNLECKL